MPVKKLSAAISRFAVCTVAPSPTSAAGDDLGLGVGGQQVCNLVEAGRLVVVEFVHRALPMREGPIPQRAACGAAGSGATTSRVWPACRDGAHRAASAHR